MLENETIDEVTQSKQVIDADNHAAASSAATQTPANAANSNTLTSNGLPPSPSFITPFIATDHQRLVFRFIGYHLKPIKMHELNFQNSQKKTSLQHTTITPHLQGLVFHFKTSTLVLPCFLTVLVLPLTITTTLKQEHDEPSVHRD